jgi:hypothetical protein
MSMIDPSVTGRGRPEARGNRGKKKTGFARGPPRRRRQTLEPAAGGPLMSIPAAGLKFYGLSKNGSYDAAARGEFGKLFEVGRRRFVVVANVEKKIRRATDEDNDEDEAA